MIEPTSQKLQTAGGAEREARELREALIWVLKFADDHGRGSYYSSFNYATRTHTWHCFGCSAEAVIPHGEEFDFNHDEGCKWVNAERLANGKAT